MGWVQKIANVVFFPGLADFQTATHTKTKQISDNDRIVRSTAWVSKRLQRNQSPSRQRAKATRHPRPCPPPASYHYFADKYAVLEELADRLLKKQNYAFASWVKDSTPEGIPVPGLASLERLFAVLIEIASREVVLVRSVLPPSGGEAVVWTPRTGAPCQRRVP